MATRRKRDGPGQRTFAGQEAEFGNTHLAIQDLATFDFSGVEYALFSAGGSVSEKYAPIAAQAGAIVIDNTSAFRYDDDIPLVVPEVNPHTLEGIGPGAIIANPNCSTIQMVVALAPIHREAGIARINVATYQSVSGAGARRCRNWRCRRRHGSVSRSRSEQVRPAHRVQRVAAN